MAGANTCAHCALQTKVNDIPSIVVDTAAELPALQVAATLLISICIITLGSLDYSLYIKLAANMKRVTYPKNDFYKRVDSAIIYNLFTY